MSMTLGRFASTEDPEAGSLRQRGDELEFSSVIVGTSLADMQARIQQLRGLVDNPDEPVVPFTWSEDANFDGFYTDLDVEVSDVPAMYAAWNVPFLVRMRRVGGYSAPQFEWIVQQMLRTNSHGITVVAGSYPGGQYAVPSSAVELNTGGSAYAYSRTSADGALTVMSANRLVGSTLFAAYFLPPASRYLGMCQLEVSYGGTYYPVMGSQIPASATWRLSNGLVRVSLTGATIAVSPYDGSQWDASATFQMGATSAAQTITSISTPRIIRNTPELVVLRLSAATSVGLSSGSQTIDISIFAGTRHVEVAYYSTAQADWYVEPTSSTASTALTGGLRATSTDADGNRFLLAGPAAQTNNLATGRLKLSSTANAFNFMIGHEVNSAGPTTQDGAQEVVNKYFQPIGSRQTIVVR
jgi:hypothetical protein